MMLAFLPGTGVRLAGCLAVSGWLPANVSDRSNAAGRRQPRQALDPTRPAAGGCGKLRPGVWCRFGGSSGVSAMVRARITDRAAWRAHRPRRRCRRARIIAGGFQARRAPSRPFGGVTVPAPASAAHVGRGRGSRLLLPSGRDRCCFSGRSALPAPTRAPSNDSSASITSTRASDPGPAIGRERGRAAARGRAACSRRIRQTPAAQARVPTVCVGDLAREARCGRRPGEARAHRHVGGGGRPRVAQSMGSSGAADGLPLSVGGSLPQPSSASTDRACSGAVGRRCAFPRASVRKSSLGVATAAGSREHVREMRPAPTRHDRQDAGAMRHLARRRFRPRHALLARYHGARSVTSSAARTVIETSRVARTASTLEGWRGRTLELRAHLEAASDGFRRAFRGDPRR
jgi:hypothetical protein